MMISRQKKLLKSRVKDTVHDACYYAAGEIQSGPCKVGSGWLCCPHIEWEPIRETNSHATRHGTFFLKLFYDCIVPMGFLPWGIRIAFPGKSHLRQSQPAQPTVHAGCFSASIIHRALTWTTGSLTCAQMFMHAIAHGV